MGRANQICAFDAPLFIGADIRVMLLISGCLCAGCSDAEFIAYCLCQMRSFCSGLPTSHDDVCCMQFCCAAGVCLRCAWACFFTLVGNNFPLFERKTKKTLSSFLSVGVKTPCSAAKLRRLPFQLKINQTRKSLCHIVTSLNDAVLEQIRFCSFSCLIKRSTSFCSHFQQIKCSEKS